MQDEPDGFKVFVYACSCVALFIFLLIGLLIALMAISGLLNVR